MLIVGLGVVLAPSAATQGTGGGQEATSTQATTTVSRVTPKVDVSRETPRGAVAAEFGTSSVMYRIAGCESHFHQFNEDGTVYRGVQNHHDIGIFQVNETYHAAEAARLGMNIYTLEGNVRFARWLYNHEGTTPWNWSKDCWG